MAHSTPQVPPRPTRRQDRSASPNRDAFARSPLHDAAFTVGKIDSKTLNTSGMTENDVPQRPPSVTLPSIGQEGSEYASLDEMSKEQDTEVQTTKGIAGDLPLHAPTASVPSSTAKSRIAGVTRTDSAQAAVAGIGKAYTEIAERSPSASNHMTRSTSSLGGRPLSINEPAEPGIPEIGVQVPMYPNAGDVQAPTPAPSHVGNHHRSTPGDGPQLRKKHSREVFHGPPGSYGLHGHGILPKDPIERAWYEKHPEALAQEAQGEYGPAIVEDRKEWMLSSDDLNKLVHAGALRATSTGESVPEGQPDEQIGYLASEEYTMRIASSSRPQSVHKHRTGSSQSHADSPLRKQSFPAEDVALERTRSGMGNGASSSAVESETEDDIYHIDPSQRSSRIAELGHDLRYTVVPEDDLPILAADEVAKRPASGYMMPAVEPELERFHQHEELSPMATGTRSTSRPTSRSNSVAATPNIPRFHIDHELAMTPLDDVQEYEPLFPDDEKSGDRQSDSAEEKSKRSGDIPRHHFPSRDIWEDTPDSLQLQTTIDSPPPPEELKETGMPPAGAVFEHPEAEANRKAALGGPLHENAKASSLQRSSPEKTHFNQDILDEMNARPDVPQRFPSRDIWEDTPDHHQLIATVDAPETKDTEAPAQAAKTIPPAVPARPARTKQADNQSSSSAEKPALPERPKQKPVLPARPSKPKPRDSNEQVPLAKTTSNNSASGGVASPSPTDGPSDSIPPAPKQKPAVPARPAGGKIAALKAGFMNDLNNRLQLGPKPVKQEEEESAKAEAKEVAPLADARKGRARGPQRRKPGTAAAASPSPAGVADKMEKPNLQFATPIMVWQISEDGILGTGPGAAAEAKMETTSKEQVDAEPAADTEHTGTDAPEATQAPDTLPKVSNEPIIDALAAAKAETAAEAVEALSKPSQDGTVATAAEETETLTTFVGGGATAGNSEEAAVAGEGDEGEANADTEAKAEVEAESGAKGAAEAADDIKVGSKEAGADEGETLTSTSS
jgi:hypothetical protein